MILSSPLVLPIDPHPYVQMARVANGKNKHEEKQVHWQDCLVLSTYFKSQRSWSIVGDVPVGLDHWTMNTMPLGGLLHVEPPTLWPFSDSGVSAPGAQHLDRCRMVAVAGKP